MSNGAPCLSVSIDGREFQCTGDGTASPIQGGYTGEYNSNGDPNTGRWVMTPKGWSLPGQSIAIDPANGGIEYIEEKIATMKDLAIVANYIDQIISATGRIEGDLEYDPSTAAATISFKGSGKYSIKSF